jgi:hypothetical protein
MRCERFVLGLVSVVGTLGCDPGPLPENPDDFIPVIQVPDCRPDNNGVIESSELPVVLGAVARVRVGQNVPVDIDGEVIGGVTTWDLTRPEVQTEPVGTLSVESMEGQWFAGLFPSADIAAPLLPGGSQLGPLLVEDDGWKLLGAASKDEDPPEGQTRVVYDIPTVLYPFPLQLGSRVTTTSRAQNAVLLGIPTAFDDTTEVEVVGLGTVILPDLILENTLQVRVRFSRTLLAGDVQQVSYIFVHECLGEVARFVSEAVPLSEPRPDGFATAKEVWRLAL